MGLLARLRRRGGLLGSLKEYGALGFVDRGLRLVWHQAGMRVLAVVRPPHRSKYGWLEALLLPSHDFWVRYAVTCQKLLETCPSDELQILEVGSGPIGLSSFLRHEAKLICMVDRAYESVAGPQSEHIARICCNACNMPFADGAFPVVVSLDTLEHIPREHRSAFLKELKRVAGQAVILTCPIDSAGGEFQAKRCDTELADGLRRRGTPSARWPEEHLLHGQPTIAELETEFERASIYGFQNSDAWIRFHFFNSRRFAWLLGGAYYLLALAAHDTDGPYYRALLVWQRPKLSSSCQAEAGGLAREMALSGTEALST